MARILLLAIAAMALIAVGCGDSDDDNGEAATSSGNAAQTTGADDAMEEGGDAMKSEGEAMKKEGRASGDAMESENDAMEREGDAMEKEGDDAMSEGAAMQGSEAAKADAAMVADRRAQRRSRAKRRRGRAVKVVSSQFGKVIADGRGEAVYLFDKEKSRRSQCYGACARAWPPLLTRGRPRAFGGARARLLGVTRRKGGALQVTYRGRPLYYYKDDRPGLILCQNVAEFGGLWLVVKPNGAPVT